MSLVKTWYQPQLAADKFGIKLETILQWVADGLVRSEETEGEVVQVNIDDVRLEVDAMVREP
jgi:predicted site-specific integrase-resolvase